MKTIGITDNTWKLICRARQLGNGKNLQKYQSALHAAARALIEDAVKPGLTGFYSLPAKANPDPKV